MTQPLPPRYFWLWHLAAMKVVDATFGAAPAAVSDMAESALPKDANAKIMATRWDEIGADDASTATVALIDTGVSRKHPNLASRIDSDRAIDLTTHRYGAQHLGPQADTTPMTREGRRAFFTGLSTTGLRLSDLTPNDADFLAAMVAEYAGSMGVVRYLAEPEESFAVHGTACAGLIVGEPAAVKTGEAAPQPPSGILTGGAINPDPNTLPYFGVDPFSRLLPIRTSFEEDPYQFIAAFLYAWHCKVDAIVLPRGLPDPIRSRLSPKESLKANLETWANHKTADLFQRLQIASTDVDPTASQTGYQPDRAWRILRQLILSISQQIPIFCAAGNDGESQLIYPANLAEPDNGIFAVGAVTAEGFRSGYSNYGDGLTLVMPSDDFEILNKHQIRIDRLDPLGAMHDFKVGHGVEVAYCPLDLVTTDLPGVFGYDGGSAPWSSILPSAGTPGAGGGYYTSFGGTSGATSLAGGLATLTQRMRRRAGKLPFTGPQMKAAMVASASLSTAVAPGTRALTPDPMNADDEHYVESSYFFGAGLPDAKALLALAKTQS
jgi:subtilisin family serine protease